MLSDGLASCLGNKQASWRWRPIGSRALVLAVLGGHVGIAGADVLVAGGARRDAAAALAAGVARPQAHLGAPGLAAPVRAARAAVCTQPMQEFIDDPAGLIIYTKVYT